MYRAVATPVGDVKPDSELEGCAGCSNSPSPRDGVISRPTPYKESGAEVGTWKVTTKRPVAYRMALTVKPGRKPSTGLLPTSGRTR